MGTKIKPTIYIKPNTHKELTHIKLILSMKAGKEITFDDTIKKMLDSYKKELEKHKK